jgi:hypothetical protein
MSEQLIQDINDGKSWSEMDLFDLRNSLAYGRSTEEVAGFLCRSGTVEEVKRRLDVDISTMRIARQRTAMPRPARPRAGGGE